MAGYNTEIAHKGVIFHVQTQDKGPSAHYVESIIYKSGKVLLSRKTSYTSLLGEDSLKDKIQQIIEDQHRTILKDITEGKLDHL